MQILSLDSAFLLVCRKHKKLEKSPSFVYSVYAVVSKVNRNDS